MKKAIQHLLFIFGDHTELHVAEEFKFKPIERIGTTEIIGYTCEAIGHTQEPTPLCGVGRTIKG